MRGIVLIIISVVFLCTISSAQDVSKKDIEFYPEAIDPLHENVGDFLDIDIAKHKTKAFELYNEQKYRDAAKYYLAALSYDINDIISIYNLACCYGLLGEEDFAAKFLIRSVRAGYKDIEHIKSDPDFDKVRGKEVFDAAVDSIEKVIEEDRKDLGNTIYNRTSLLLKCRIHLPENYDPEKRYTLIIGLHGYGSNPDRFITLWKRFGDDKFIYASPQAPYPFPVGTVVGYSWGMWSENKAVSNSVTEMSEEYVCDVVKSISMRYNIDKVYLMGFSQGCAYTYSTGIKNHYLFEGLICFGGWLDTDWVPEYSIKKAKNLRVFIAHGKGDNSVKFEEGEKAFEVLKESEYDVSFHDFEGGHAVPEETMKEAISWIDEGESKE
jgi:predicted esterase